jgi:hypothetical protein
LGHVKKRGLDFDSRLGFSDAGNISWSVSRKAETRSGDALSVKNDISGFG